MDKLIILTGPTAVGKTNLSIELAKKINGEIISADSMQVYKGMDIGTAKITEEEKQGITHYLIDIFDPGTDFNAYTFKECAKKAMNQIYSKGKIPIVVGGTGFYIQALLYDVDFTEESDDAPIRAELEHIYNEKGADHLFEMLREIDPESCNIIHKNNIKKVIRAISFYKMTGTKISSHNEEQKNKSSPYDFRYFVLNNTREILYERIDKRVDLMIEAGLVNEVKSLRNKGYDKSNISMQGLGYKEILSYLDGDISLDAAVNEIKLGTRHFAKRQLTWFRREKDVIWVNKNEFENEEQVLDYILSRI